MTLVLRSRFRVGVYDPKTHDSWPYYFSDEGLYLSKNYRFCSFKSAIEFEAPTEVREFYSKWKHAGRYKLYPVEYKIHVDVPPRVFPEDHPNSIYKRICDNEHSFVCTTASFWFYGDSVDDMWSKATLAKHREILLAYGIDIYTKPDRLLETSHPGHDHTWYLSKPTFEMV